MTEENRKPGTPEYWCLWSDYRAGLGRAVYVIRDMQGNEMVYGKGLEREEGYEQCLAMLDEAEAAIQKARDARRRLHDLSNVRVEAA